MMIIRKVKPYSFVACLATAIREKIAQSNEQKGYHWKNPSFNSILIYPSYLIKNIINEPITIVDEIALTEDILVLA